MPHVKQPVMRGVPKGATRLAMLKKGQADITNSMQAELGEEVRRDPSLQLVDTRHASIYWLEFADQWDPKSYGRISACGWW